MGESNATLPFEYEWLNPNSKNLVNALRAHIVPFVGENANIWGRITQKTDEMEIEHSTNSLDELEQKWGELEASAGSSTCKINFSVSLIPGERSFNISFEPQYNRLDGTIKVDTSEVGIARILLETVRSELGATVFDEKTKEYRPLARVERRYQFPKGETPQQLYDIFDFLGALIPSSSINQIRLQGDYQYGTEILSSVSRQEWMEGIQKKWAELKSTSIWCNAEKFVFNIYFFLETEELTVRLETPVQQDGVNALENLELTFGLKPYTDQPVLHSGQTHEYYSQKSLTSEWASRMLNIIRPRFQPRRYFSGAYEVSLASSQEKRTEDISQWEKEIIENWQQLTRFSVSFSQRDLRIDLNGDPLREIIRITVETSQQPRTETIFAELEKELELDPIISKPFQIRVFNDYKISPSWLPENYVAGVKAVLTSFFDKFVLLTAVVVETSDSNSKKVYFNTLADYLNRVQDDTKRFARTELYVEGPRGQALRINLNDTEKKIGFDSTKDTNVLVKLEETFGKLGLKKIKEIDKKVEDEKPKQSAADFIIKVIIPVVTFLFGILGATAVWSNVIPTYRLEITVPVTQPSKDMAVLSTGEVHVDWRLVKKQLFQTMVTENSLATIRVLENGNKTIQVLTGQTNEVTLNLPPGEYIIYVGDENIKQDETLQFIKVLVQTPPPTSEPAPAAQPADVPTGLPTIQPTP